MTEPASFARSLSGAVSRASLSSHPSSSRLLSLVVVTCGFWAALNLHAQTPAPTEYEVEAAYLSNFGRFVEWPLSAGNVTDSFSVCVLGSDPFGSLLNAALKGERIGGAPMVARRLSEPEEAAGCRILFVSSSKVSQLSGILKALGTSKVLTVSDMTGFTRRGGMIQFVRDGKRVRFEINLAAAQRKGLVLSSELLKVAVAIRRTP